MMRFVDDARKFAREISATLGRLSRRQDEMSAQQADLGRQVELLREAVGRLEARQIEQSGFTGLAESEFRAFSQWGEDGIIQALIRLVPIRQKVFVEFGIQDYREANTRFLLLNNHWRGLVLECDEESVAALKTTRAYLNHPLTAERAFVTRENINQLLTENGLKGDIGLLSIDVDGNDYWIWEAIDEVRPSIVVAEYNHRFGPERAVTIPYDPHFSREKAHPSMIYYGASLAALAQIGLRKGYDLVGCTRSGVNAFFVRADLRPDALPALSPLEAYVAGSVAEWRDESGRQVRVAPEEERALLFSLPLVDVAQRRDGSPVC
jgi:hypothetical protein